jgi:hypothetical protein
MRTEQIFKTSIILVAVLVLFVKVSEAQEKIELQTVYSLEINISKDDTAVLNKITAVNGTITSFPTIETKYSISVLSPDNNLGVSFLVSDIPIQLNRTVVYPRVPYYSDAKYISVYHQDKEIIKIDLSKEFCNNNKICNLGENQYNCPDDCKQPLKIPWVIIILVGIVLILILLIIFLRKKKPSEKKSSTKDYDALKEKWKRP